jgi:hypothetical protein
MPLIGDLAFGAYDWRCQQMSLDTEALLDLSTEGASPESLLQWLLAHPAFASELVGEYGHHWTPEAWAIDANPSGSPCVIGPGGFAISFTPRTLRVWHMMPFSTFAGAPAQRHAFRRACFDLAKVVGSSRAIFTHEMMPTPGEGLDQIEAGLRSQIGTAAASFEELLAAEPYSRGAWYVDNFDDLRLVEVAEEIARKTHAGQFRRGGSVPCIEHLKAVAQRVRDDPEAQVAAWLHAVLEEAGETEESLRKAGIPAHLVAAIALMTRAWGTPYEDYFERVAGSPLATRVMIAAMLANLAANPSTDEIRRDAKGLLRLTREHEASQTP